MDLPGSLPNDLTDSYRTIKFRDIHHLVSSQKERRSRFFGELGAHEDDIKQNSPTIKKRLKRYFVITQWCFLFPVEGITKEDRRSLNFSWKSNATTFCLLSLAASTVAFLATLSKVFNTKINYYDFADIISFSLVSVLLKVLFLRQASQWPDFAEQWAVLEKKLKPLLNDFTTSDDSEENCDFIINVYIAATLVFIVVDYLPSLDLALQCSQDFFEGFNLIVAHAHTEFYSKSTFSLWKAIVPAILKLHEKLIWMLMDLNVILLSRSVCAYFRRINRRMSQVQHKAMPKSFWLYMRESYTSATHLSQQLDRHLGWMNLYCFGSPLYFITAAMLRTFSAKRVLNLISEVYSLVYVVGCFVTTSHSASAIHEESKAPLQILFAVPAESYCTEVARFQVQACHSEAALSGCKYFSITRSFMLTVAGTIVTYEIVLLQFGTVDFYNQYNNITNVCNNLMETVYSGQSRVPQTGF